MPRSGEAENVCGLGRLSSQRADLCRRWNKEPRGTYWVTMLSLGGLVQAPMNLHGEQS